MSCCQSSCSHGDVPAVKCPGTPDPSADPAVPSWCVTGEYWCVTGEYWWCQPRAAGGHSGSQMFVSLGIGAAAAFWGPRKSSLGGTALCSNSKTPWEWDTLGKLQMPPAPALCSGSWTGGMLSSEIQHFQGSGDSENICCVGPKQHWTEPGVLDIWVGHTSNLHFRHLEGHSILVLSQN